MKLCVYEDNFYANFYPLSFTRPIYELRCGFDSLRSKTASFFPDLEVDLHCRTYLAEVVKEYSGLAVNDFQEDVAYLFINGRVIFDESLFKSIRLDNTNCLYVSGKTEVAAVLSEDNVAKLKVAGGEALDFEKAVDDVKKIEVEATVVQYHWDLVALNKEELEKDFTRFCKKPEIKGKLYDGVHLLAEEAIYIGDGSKVKPGVVIDAETGPVYIDEDVEITPNVLIQGPVFIGSKTKIKPGARIYDGTTIGEYCKIAGEVEASIIHAFSNKQHDGFLGHSYLGEWVNIGADTNTSDLKNNYGNVKMPVNGKLVDTGQKFIGMVMGDHSKTGINTMFNTGSVVGVHCNVFGSGFPPKDIPSFTWGGKENFVEYELQKAIATADIVFGRRQKELSETGICLIKEIFKETNGIRNTFLENYKDVQRFRTGASIG